VQLDCLQQVLVSEVLASVCVCVCLFVVTLDGVIRSSGGCIPETGCRLKAVAAGARLSPRLVEELFDYHYWTRARPKIELERSLASSGQQLAWAKEWLQEQIGHRPQASRGSRSSRLGA